MNYQLQLQVDDQPAVLERVLQTARYRGFALHSFNMVSAGDNKLSINMQVGSDQPIARLTTQLNKLYDLSSLKIEPQVSLQHTA